jgi:hypothetical protein
VLYLGAPFEPIGEQFQFRFTGERLAYSAPARFPEIANVLRRLDKERLLNKKIACPAYDAEENTALPFVIPSSQLAAGKLREE